MGITGNLKTMELAELLQWLSGSQKTGTLVVDNKKIRKEIHFRDGLVISSASTDPKEHLGSFLVSHGFITDLELKQAVQMQEVNKMLLGKILVTIGAISEGDLGQMLRLKAEESIYDVFTWPEGDFRFLDLQLPTSMMVPLALDTTGIVLEGMQRLDEWRRIREAIPGLDAIPVSVGEFDAGVMFQGSSHILALVDDQRTIEEICRATHASEFHVCRILYRQIQAGRLKVVRGRRNGAGGPSEGGDAGVFSAEGLAKVGAQLLERGDFDGALRHARAARALDPDSRKAAAEALKIEEKVKEEIERAGVTLQAIPVLGRTMEELAKLQISPQEGFMLTRITGGDNLQALLRITPMPPLDAQLILWKLARAGHVRFEKR